MNITKNQPQNWYHFYYTLFQLQFQLFFPFKRRGLVISRFEHYAFYVVSALIFMAGYVISQQILDESVC